MKRKNKKQNVETVNFVEFGLNKNNSVYLRNASYALGKAAAIAENSGDTETLLSIAGAWLEIDKLQSRKGGGPGKKKLKLGFTPADNFDRMSPEEEEDNE